jgi:hypothetical protein
LNYKKAELEHLKAEVQKAIASLDTNKLPTGDSVAIARVNLSEVLTSNGWPADIAANDAGTAVAEIQHQLWSQKLEDQR